MILMSIVTETSKAFSLITPKHLIECARKVYCTKLYAYEKSELVKRFLSDRYQRVVLKGQTPSCADIKTGVPQG